MKHLARAKRKLLPGQATTELALSISVFLLFMFSVAQMAEVVLAYNSIASAAHVAARSAIIHGEGTSDESAVQQVAINAAPGLPLTTSDVTVTFPTDNSVPSKLDVKVVIDYSYAVKIPFRSSVTFPLTATSQMPVSQ